jgi:squalene-hopene/tetraprenyl-beta-curcumene cyclase
MALVDILPQSDPLMVDAVGFLTRSQRAEGSWPIDTDLATWATTLALKALGDEPGLDAARAWVAAQQSQQVHAYTLSAPGAWAWTDLAGGVPDADDTAGALLALAEGPSAIGEAGVAWLLGLQNRDGGIPTFCRGWGALPFDRSTPELTAHALAAWRVWQGRCPHLDLAYAMRRGLDFLQSVQRGDGAWIPLWFGNEHAPGAENPVYGTACVVRALAGWPEARALLGAGVNFLISTQHPEGAWSGARDIRPTSIEETALATEALACFAHASGDPAARAAALRGAEALRTLTQEGTVFPAAPIGLYFAKLWYHERLYPLIFTVAAWRAVQRL